MIKGKDIYEVLSALVPLYVAMALGFGSVRWWKILTPDQCAGVNRFVAVFAVPFLSFNFISSNNPYAMNFKFLAGDSLQKAVVLAALFLWNFTGFGSIDWTITLFAIFALPNTLVMGVPLLKAMYGEFSTSLMIQIVVMQSCIWNTLLMIMFEYRGAKLLIQEQFPETAGSISTLRVDPDVGSLSGRDPLQADAKVGEDGKLHVVLRRSTSNSVVSDSSFRSYNLPSMTPRASSLSGVEIYSVHSHSPRELTPRNPSLSSQIDMHRSGSQGAGLEEDVLRAQKKWGGRSISGGSSELSYGGLASPYPHAKPGLSGSASTGSQRKKESIGGGRDLHMFVWSPSASPASSDVNMRRAGNRCASADIGTMDPSEIVHVPHETDASKDAHELIDIKEKVTYPFSGSRKKVDTEEGDPNRKQQMPSVGVMTRLILIMVWRKLIRNPNTWASILGLMWSFIAFRFNIKLPAMIKGSITIVSNTGMGMAMFSLGLFMALQPKIIACGKKWAAISMAVRFLGGPSVIAASSAAIGIRGVLLQVEIVQAALPQGIIPFVFAKEYNLHADIFSTAVIFGMVVALPVTIIYYVLLGL